MKFGEPWNEEVLNKAFNILPEQKSPDYIIISNEAYRRFIEIYIECLTADIKYFTKKYIVATCAGNTRRADLFKAQLNRLNNELKESENKLREARG